MLLDIFKKFLQWAFLIFRFIDKETEPQGGELLKGGGTGGNASRYILDLHFTIGNHTASLI